MKIIRLLALCGATGAFAGLGSAQIQIPDSVEATRDIEYCKGGGRPLLLDMYLPKNPRSKPAPAVLWIHGGGWRAGDKSPAPLAVELASKGFVAASVAYRLSGEAPFPAQIEDSKCAIRYLRANAAKYAIDPNRIGVAGGSAGAHLALLVATSDASAGLEGSGGWDGFSSRVAAALSWYGPADFSVGHNAFEKGQGPSIAKFLGGTREEKPDNYRRASPVAWVSKDDPPLLLIHGTDDSTVPFDQSVRMEAAYRKLGLPVELIPVKNAEHTFRQAGADPISPSRAEIIARSVAFFEKNLAGDSKKP